MGVEHRIFSYGKGSDNDISLPNNISTPINIYSLTNSHGYLNAIYLKFNSDDILINLIIDGIDIFQELDLEIVDELSPKEDTTRLKTIGILRDRDVFYYTPNNPIRFKESIIIKARCNKDSTNHKFEKYILDMEIE